MSNNRQNTTRETALEFFGKRQFDKALPLIVELIEDGEQDSDLYYMAGQCYRSCPATKFPQYSKRF